MQPKHFLQSQHWAKVRELQGHKIVWINGALMTVKQMPKPFKNFGYMPQVITKDLNWQELATKAKELDLSHVLIDPGDEEGSYDMPFSKLEQNLRPATEVYYRNTLILDLTKSVEELQAEMHRKHRYNIRVADKHNVAVEVRDDDEALEIFLKLFFETVTRQKYLGRTPEYYRQIWQVLRPEEKVKVAIASYQGQPLVAWMLFLHEGVIYYPYGGSSSEHREVMASNALVWGLIQWGQQQGYQHLDLWGIDPQDGSQRKKQHGFTRFKLGFGGRVVNYLHSQDLIISPIHYYLFKGGNAGRWVLLNLRKIVSR